MTIKHSQEENVWFLSDLHIGHDKEFVWKARGFNSVGEMNETIIKNIKATVGENEHFYILGDLVLCPVEEARYWLSQIPGKVHVIIGNHDTDSRIELYKELGFDCQYGARLRYKKYHFFLSHYPTLTANQGEDKLTLAHINLYAHTHQKTWKSNYSTFAYHVGVDAHNCYPVEINTIISTLKDKNIQKD